jgi:hypothetical protein
MTSFRRAEFLVESISGAGQGQHYRSREADRPTWETDHWRKRNRDLLHDRNASDKGAGMYEGKGELGSRGTWQVTIRAHMDRALLSTIC